MITTNEVLTHKVGKLYLHYFIPTICGTLMGSVYGFADLLFIGRGVGGNALAALSIATPMYSMFSTLVTLIGLGGATAMAVLRGQQKEEDADQYFTQSMLLLTVLSVVFTALMQLFIEPVAVFLGATPEILDMVVEYMRIVCWAIPGFLLSWSLGSFVRNDGNPRLVMWASVIPNCFNVVFDYIFVFPLAMGIAGAALATALSPILGLLLLLLHFLRGRNTIRLVRPHFTLSSLGRILRNGSSYAILEASSGILIFSFNNLLIRLSGEMAVSAYAVLMNIGWFVFSITSGFIQAAQPIIGVNYGAGQFRRCRQAFTVAGLWGVGFAAAVMVVLLVEPAWIIQLFAGDEDRALIELAVTSGRKYFTMILPQAVNVVVLGFIQACERYKQSIVVSLARGLVLILAALYGLAALFGVDGVWWATTVSESCTVVLSALLLVSIFRSFHQQESRMEEVSV